MDLFEISESEQKEERLKERAKEVLAAIEKIDPTMNVVAIFCDIIHSFVVKEDGKFNLYIFNDYDRLDSFRFDNWSFKGIPSNFIRVK